MSADKPANRWTTAEDALLRRLWLQGGKTHAIAKRLGRGDAAVATRRRKLNLPPRITRGQRDPAARLVEHPRMTQVGIHQPLGHVAISEALARRAAIEATTLDHRACRACGAAYRSRDPWERLCLGCR